MFGLFSRRRGKKKSLRCVPDGTRVYAIGDIHGCRDELEQLFGLIDSDSQSFAGHTHLIFLGDLVDRGPDSAGVVEIVRRCTIPGSPCHVLMGNHEEAMLAAFDGEQDPRGWLNYGGFQTLESYGVARAEHFSPGFNLAQRMREAIPAEHIAFLRSRPSQFAFGDYLFVHAGIRPGVPLERQDSADLRWIRAGFLDSEVDHGFTVVHGHTISAEPENFANRIGIDTGCYAGGHLTALVLEGCEQRFLQVPAGSA